MVWRVLVKRLRDRLDLSQQDLAQLLGRSTNTISRWERGDMTPNADARETLREMIGDRDPLLADLRVIEYAPTCTRYSLYYTPWETISCSPSYARLYHKTPEAMRNTSLWCLLPKAGQEMHLAVSMHANVLNNTAVTVDATIPFHNGSLRIWGQAFLMNFWRWDLQYISDPLPFVVNISTLEDFAPL